MQDRITHQKLNGKNNAPMFYVLVHRRSERTKSITRLNTQLFDLETDCLTFETYWVQDKACRGLISRHDFHMLAGCA